jgi:hypothetical protein
MVIKIIILKIILEMNFIKKEYASTLTSSVRFGNEKFLAFIKRFICNKIP